MTRPELDVDGSLLLLSTAGVVHAVDIAGTARQVAFGPSHRLGAETLKQMRSGRLGAEAELQLAGDDRPLPQHGTRWTGCGSTESTTVRSHRAERLEDGGLHVVLSSSGAQGLEMDLHFLARPGSSCLTRWTSVRATELPLTVDHVSSGMLRGLAAHGDFDALWLHTYDGGWCWEGALRSRPVTDIALYPESCINAWSVETTGSWPSKHVLPFYVLEDRAAGISYGMQVDACAGWRMEVGAESGTVYTQAGGPNHAGGHGRRVLHPGQLLETVPVVVGTAEGGRAEVVDAFHRHRWLHQAPREPRRGVVYNEYHATMNTLDASTVAAQTAALTGTGVETFVLDAGWYSPQTPEGEVATWWALAGDWTHDESRFPAGMKALAEDLNDAGLVAGIWLEPEVAGLASRLVAEHPDWLLRRDGRLLLDAGRAFLDLRQPQVRDHLAGVLDGLVDHGYAYFKFDYNTEVVPGPDAAPHGPGQGALELAAGWQAVLDGLRVRHPHVVLENCASGGGRTSYGLLSRTHLGSVSDHGHWNGGWRSFPNVLRAVLDVLHPSQAVSWAVPEPDLSLAETRYRLVTGLLGRMTLSGPVDRLDEGQRALMVEAVAFANASADLLAKASVRRHGPEQPLHRTEALTALEVFSPAGCLLGVWRQDTEDDRLRVRPHGLREGQRYHVQTFPAGAAPHVLVGGSELTLHLPERFDAVAVAVRAVDTNCREAT
ncbi:glycoside hydrolase family 36 protein [Streptomyces sp. NPDC091268]|uniref:glycoside hydrolase family 36 protein n=1 Tax=Streptomyces sp. NPDC091268 TaxID=3365979 RepID=UPI00381BA9C9